jgi:hypothetical protein
LLSSRFGSTTAESIGGPAWGGRQPGFPARLIDHFSFYQRVIAMDKKVKKKTHVLQQRIQTLRQQLAGMRKQMDDRDELKSVEQQLAAAEVELSRIKEV